MAAAIVWLIELMRSSEVIATPCHCGRIWLIVRWLQQIETPINIAPEWAGSAAADVLILTVYIVQKECVEYKRPLMALRSDIHATITMRVR